MRRRASGMPWVLAYLVRHIAQRKLLRCRLAWDARGERRCVERNDLVEMRVIDVAHAVAARVMMSAKL